MYAVIFEVWPDPDYYDDYLALGAALRADVEKIDGFISIERFGSLVEEGKLVSLSFWRDEAAIDEWRNQMAHRKAQARGRAQYFKDYRLRVSKVVRDYGPEDRAQAPE